MKKWIVLLLVLLLCLSACKKEEPALVAEPYDLEIEYGDSGVQAMKGGFDWTAGSRNQTASVVDPRQILSDVPFVNETKDKKLNLLFAVEPDTVTVRRWSSEDGYKTAADVDCSRLKLAVPTDGASYLYEVEAVWELNEKIVSGGTCTYHFRFLPEHATGEQSLESVVHRLTQMEAYELFGVEFFNNLDQEKKLCTDRQDREAILDYLQTYLTVNFRQIDLPEAESDYVLRFAVTDGTQLTLSYGSNGKETWVLLDGEAYEAEVMDLYSLWKSLNTASVSMKEGISDYLQISETFPGDDWEGDLIYANLRSMEDGVVVYDEFFWQEDEKEPNGYRLERGLLGQSLLLAEDCRFWILEDHHQPWCQVEQETLWQWSEGAEWDILFRMYTKDGEISVICEQYTP